LKLFEYEAKAIAAGFSVPLPKGVVISNAEEARSAFQTIGGPAVVKAQVLVSGRGKAGGIKFATTPDEAEATARAILSSTIKGEVIQKLLIEQRVGAKNELYLGVVVNRSAGCYTILASTEGGVDIEEVSERSPEKIIRYDVDPLAGLREYEAREIVRRLGYREKQLGDLAAIVTKLYRMTLACDGELVETNPLIETPSGSFIAADFRILVDDNSLYRHPELQERARLAGPELSPLEAQAREKRLAYVDLEGDIGVIGNGAGLVMATIDLIKYYGGSPANFCDLGGGAGFDRVSAALEVVLSNARVKVLLINVLGGITRCDEIAKGILEVKQRKGIARPMVVRLVGTNEEEGRRLLREADISSVSSMEEAVREAIRLTTR